MIHLFPLSLPTPEEMASFRRTREEYTKLSNGIRGFTNNILLSYNFFEIRVIRIGRVTEGKGREGATKRNLVSKVNSCEDAVGIETAFDSILDSTPHTSSSLPLFIRVLDPILPSVE